MFFIKIEVFYVSGLGSVQLRGFRSRELTKLIDGTLGCERKEKIKQFLTFAARKKAFGAILAW